MLVWIYTESYEPIEEGSQDMIEDCIQNHYDGNDRPVQEVAEEDSESNIEAVSVGLLPFIRCNLHLFIS